MKSRKIVITEDDRTQLVDLIATADRTGGRTDLDALAQELQKARTVSSDKVPHDVVTMNSKVVLEDIDSGKEMSYKLVLPKYANVDTGAISVLAPIGTAILGYAEGDVVEWPVPAGIRRIKIKKIVFQPEAASNSPAKDAK
ncbi:MAG: GreA/GreB family elongation factor [Kiritimatiellae bacterium]|nr:GreA/GreB family elongation factor [Kiritimatiellia bacterium]MDD3544031.1 GreA/GreB family elongation factor [Kiritimatiellia bacterium]MDD4024302.1 GreA/GreB family elongation factor [Kiritimatiellia bacterium]MDD4623435.1 GreA/GreB family elongation factor [Kiritimatiellia bacterium]